MRANQIFVGEGGAHEELVSSGTLLLSANAPQARVERPSVQRTEVVLAYDDRCVPLLLRAATRRWPQLLCRVSVVVERNDIRVFGRGAHCSLATVVGPEVVVEAAAEVELVRQQRSHRIVHGA